VQVAFSGIVGELDFLCDALASGGDVGVVVPYLVEVDRRREAA